MIVQYQERGLNQTKRGEIDSFRIISCGIRTLVWNGNFNSAAAALRPPLMGRSRQRRAHPLHRARRVKPAAAPVRARTLAAGPEPCTGACAGPRERGLEI